MAEIMMTGPWSLTIPETMYDTLDRHLFPGDHDEHGAVMVAGVFAAPDGSVRLLARDLFLARDGVDYVPGKRGYRMLKAQFIQRHILACRDEKLVYLAIHNHGGRGTVAFSPDDYASHERGYPALLDISAGNAVGALVFAAGAVAGDIWLPGGRRVTLERAEITGRRWQVLRPAPDRAARKALPLYDRQTRIFGDAGQHVLAGMSVAIVGLGGVGSLVAEYLARLGVGTIWLIDPDRIDPTNLPRVVGARRADIWWALGGPFAPAWLRRRVLTFASRKVDIAWRVIRQANKATRVKIVAANVLAPEAAAALLSCDYIFLAADEMRARLLVNAIVHQYLIPGVQIGSKVSVADNGDVTDVFSVVRPLRPGMNCLWCNQLINPGKLADEAKNDGERKRQRYVDDKDVAAPSVITLNAVGAAHACNDFLFYAMGMSGAASTDFARYDSRSRAVMFSTPRTDPDCTECGSRKGSRLGHGQSGPDLPVFAR
ncbi:HesA/MoeB/ThiF family protein [Rhizobium ruizarguesonis]|uniref:HesA/MoeB/ThiF family protein n=1 Tax=Rhizobium ruizarguesonis TaxID=2081791 RepID=UPI001FD4B99F|nr:ThiF family adenylyltransferase [Rhizobium ruizarguesonis]